MSGAPAGGGGRHGEFAAGFDSCEDVRSAHEDDDAADDVVDGKDAEAETVDHHGDELPVAGRTAFLDVVLELVGDPAQFVEYRQHLGAQGIDGERQLGRNRRHVAVSSRRLAVCRRRQILRSEMNTAE